MQQSDSHDDGNNSYYGIKKEQKDKRKRIEKKKKKIITHPGGIDICNIDLESSSSSSKQELGNAFALLRRQW